MDLRSNGYEKCATRLAEYEDIELTPEQVQELKERDTAKKLEEWADGSLHCPNCEADNTCMGLKFCIECGQRIDWSNE